MKPRAHIPRCCTGGFASSGSVATKEGTRNGVVSADGSVYLANSCGGELVVVSTHALSH
jgi:hypothetical protein